MKPPRLPLDAALFLDFDGCLVEIAPRPDRVHVPKALIARLDRLQKRQNDAVALISGRDVADLRGHLDGYSGIIAGSHGAEYSPGPGVIEAIHAAPLDISALHRMAHQLAAETPDILVEEKAHGVGLHYRANPALRPTVEAIATQILSHFPELMLQPAKMAVEMRPAGIGKDDAIARLMGSPPFTGRVPVYAGDDTTDEPAMVEVQRRGGFAIKIGPGDSAARYRLDDPGALAAWLDEMLN
ncbi:MAG: trehalose-phosphatase [Paracoccus sp. (in: a-proteobacteria)]|nr:trehalose-phosphatase [Paracoccus sp. (in: a-proteobacteria)]